MAIRYGSFHIMTTCGHCGQPLPVNGPELSVECSHCFAACKIAESSLVDIFESLEDDYRSLAEGEGHGVSSMGGGGTFKYTYLRRRPQCAKCKTPLDVDAVPNGATFELPCPSCGVRWSTFPAPPWLRHCMPQAMQCFGADRDTSASAASISVDQAIPEAIAMACPSCGAGLSVTGDWQRTHPCSYCQTQVFIPDALWKRLHPIKTARHWGVRFEGQSAKEMAAAQAQQASAAQLQAVAAQPMPTDAKARCARLIEEVIASNYDATRVQYACDDIKATLNGRQHGTLAAKQIGRLLQAGNGDRALKLLEAGGSYTRLSTIAAFIVGALLLVGGLIAAFLRFR